MISNFTPTLSPIVGWDYVNPSGGLKDATDGAGNRAPANCSYNSKLYVTWSGLTSTFSRIHVSEFNPANSAWNQLSPSGGTGLNILSTDFAQSPDIFSFNSKLYCTWREGGTAKIRIKVWSGTGTSWTSVDGNATSGLNKASNRGAEQPRLVSFNSKLYAVWNESASAGGNTAPQIRCRVYNGNDASPSWTFVDGNAATGLNKSTTLNAFEATPIVFNSKLYLFWIENNSSSVLQLRCRVYNGNDASPSWTFVDGNGANGLNFDTTKSVASSVAVGLGRHLGVGVFNGKLYVMWVEGGTTVRLRVYNGDDASPSWTFVDGNTSSGFNFVAGTAVDYIGLVTSSAWNPHLFWGEGTPKAVKASVYNGEDSSSRRVDTVSSEFSFGAQAYITGTYLGDTIYVSHIGTPTAIYVVKARV